MRNLFILVLSFCALSNNAHAFSVDGIPANHLQCEDGCISYYANLSLVDIGKPKRRDFFYHVDTNSTKLRLVDNKMEYHFMNGIRPCGNPSEHEWNEKWAKLPEAALSKKIARECNAQLYAHYPTRIEPLEITTPQPEWTDGWCSNKSLDVVATLKSTLNEKPLFISTMGKNGGKEFFSSQVLKTERPKFVKDDWFVVPTGFSKQQIAFYRYPDEPNAYLAFVRAKGFWESPDADKYGKSKERIWQAYYYVTPKGAKIITPRIFEDLDHFGVRDENEDFSLAGITDVNDDGYNDIIIGTPAKLILERYGQGFRSWGFGFYPGRC